MELFVTIAEAIAVLVFVAAMAYAAISDARSFEVPNQVPIFVVLAFLIMMLTSTQDWADNLNNIFTGLAVLVAGFSLFAFRLFGAGDVKLLTAIALWFGWPQFIIYLFFVVMVGGVLSLLLILFRRYPLSSRLSASGWVGRLHSRKKDVPYAVAIAIPAILYLPRIPLLAHNISW